MPTGYQPPKLQQFDGKGNPKQHIAHFIKTCNNAGTDGDHLVKQFVRSLKGNAFDWYVDLEPESIDNWDEMEREFLNRFYSTRCTVSMIELTNARQWKDEPVVDYINRWRSLSLNCKDKLSEASAIEMCIQGMHWGLLYILQGIKSRNFEELATRAHDMELSIANHKTAFSIDEQRKDKKDLKRSEKFTKPSTKEFMAIKTAPIKISSNSGKKSEKSEDQRMTNDRRRPTLKELQEKEYPFPDSDVPYIFDELLERKLIELPESKRPDETKRVNDPKYCKYHRVVSHPIERCFVVKEKIMALAKEGKIILDVEETVGTNIAGITAANNKHVLEGKQEVKQSSTTTLSTLQFGSFKPIQIEALFVNEEKEKSTKDDDGWTLVTRQQRQRRKVDKFHPSLPRKSRLHKQPHHAKARNKTEIITRQRLPVTLEEFFPQIFFEQKDKAVSASPRIDRRQPLVSCCATYLSQMKTYCSCIDEGSDSDFFSEDEIQNAPPELEDGVQATVDELKELNLGTTEDPRPIFVSALLSPEKEEQYFKTLGEYRYVFAWTCKEMLGLDPKLAIHHLGIRHGAVLEVKYPTWISSIVPVKKKNGQIRICVDFRDLNKACLKDDFPLPIIELMVDATTGHEALCFMDGSSRYNQIRMSPKDVECMAFRTRKGIYWYKVDDLVVKTKKREKHLADLQIVFDRLRKYNLKMNPLKCAFSVSSGKFVGFIVRHRGIEVDPAKVDAIQKMPPPRNLKELRKLKYSPVEKVCLALFYAIKKLRHYFEAYSMRLISHADPVKFVMSRPVLSERLAKWSIVFNQYEIKYVPQKAIKGQALANFLADHPMPAEWDISDDFPDEDVFSVEILPAWTMFFDGAARSDGAGAGVVFVSPEKQVLTYSFVLGELCSNNVAEYQALIIGPILNLGYMYFHKSIQNEYKVSFISDWLNWARYMFN
ncbi:UNVERIFIED_CONTAM: Transposon Tf2-12 polyprotein [Sesamum radiatum]|uniref:Transposon Tf2-12 polyprotein n=1 Tax=Sesamum radiatum TaxID=300843 RepID=A0AAW2U891_SESRA